MSFHPDQNLPGCMMPDGGECCEGHRAVCEDWHKQRAEIEKLSYQLVSAEKQLAVSFTSEQYHHMRTCLANERNVVQDQLVIAKEALELIAGRKDYTSEHYEAAHQYKTNEGTWTLEEATADIALDHFTDDVREAGK